MFTERRRGSLCVGFDERPRQSAALAFLVAKTAIDEGHTVALFPAGDAMPLMRDSVLDNLSGLGTGKLRDTYDAIVKGGGRFFSSGMSRNARDVTAADLKGKPADFATPNVLVRLSLEHDLKRCACTRRAASCFETSSGRNPPQGPLRSSLESSRLKDGFARSPGPDAPNRMLPPERF